MAQMSRTIRVCCSGFGEFGLQRVRFDSQGFGRRGSRRRGLGFMMSMFRVWILLYKKQCQSTLFTALLPFKKS